MDKTLVAAAIALALSGCGGADKERADQLQGQVSKLQTEVNALRSELEEERYGAQRLLAVAKNAKTAGNIDLAKSRLNDLIARYPEKTEAATAQALLGSIEREQQVAQNEKNATEAKKAEELKAATERLDKNLKKETDEIKGITWVSHKSVPVRDTHLSLYFGLEGEKSRVMPLRLKLQYHADSWLFVERVTIKVDEKTYELGGMSFERDNSYGGIWEWSDTLARDQAMLRKIADGKKVTIRFEGHQYYNDFVLPDSQKRAIKEMIFAWESYGGKA